MSVVRELLAKFGVDFDAKGANKAETGIGALQDKLEKFASVAAGSALIGGVFRFGQSIAEWGNELTNSAAALGMSTESLLAWRSAGEQVGMTAEDIKGAFNALTANIASAAAGSADAARSFTTLGVDLRDTNGELKTTDQLMAETAAAIAAMPNPTERSAMALRLLGEQGARLIPLFADGTGRIDEIRATIRDLYGEDLANLGQQSQRFQQQMGRMNMGIDALKTRIGLALLPTLSNLVEGVAKIATGFGKLTRGTHAVEIALGILTVAATAAGIAMIEPFLPALAVAALIAAAIGVVVLIVDDLIAMFTGGESVIAEFIDTLFGVGTAKEVVETLTAVWDGLVEAIENTPEALRFIRDTWVDIFNSISASWTAFTDRMVARWTAVKTGFVDGIRFIRDTWLEIFAAVSAKASEFFDFLDEGWEGIKSTIQRLASVVGIDVNLTSTPRARPPAAPPPTAPSAGSSTSTNSVRQNNTTTVVVQGASNPQATARAVTAEISRTRAQELRAARNALVPVED